MSFLLPRRQFLMTVTAASAVSWIGTGAQASTAMEIEMLNRHPDVKGNMVYYPEILVAQPGDVVRFLASDRGHNSESIEGMLPAGVEGWRGGMNEEVELALETPGFYGYVCRPHAAMGMAGIIVVEGDGKMDNFEAAKAVEHRPKRLREKFEALFAQIEADGLATA